MSTQYFQAVTNNEDSGTYDEINVNCFVQNNRTQFLVLVNSNDEVENSYDEASIILSAGGAEALRDWLIEWTQR